MDLIRKLRQRLQEGQVPSKTAAAPRQARPRVPGNRRARAGASAAKAATEPWSAPSPSRLQQRPVCAQAQPVEAEPRADAGSLQQAEAGRRGAELVTAVPAPQTPPLITLKAGSPKSMKLLASCGPRRWPDCPLSGNCHVRWSYGRPGCKAAVGPENASCARSSSVGPENASFARSSSVGPKNASFARSSFTRGTGCKINPV